MKIVIKDLSKVYKNGKRALSDVNLEIEKRYVWLIGAKRSRKIKFDAHTGHHA
jgi:ABC-type phosphate/phosphonate transport system ATPase subunit